MQFHSSYKCAETSEFDFFHGHTCIQHSNSERERERERGRERDRERQRHRDRQTDTDTERDRDRDTETEIMRQTKRHADKQTERDTHIHSKPHFPAPSSKFCQNWGRRSRGTLYLRAAVHRRCQRTLINLGTIKTLKATYNVEARTQTHVRPWKHNEFSLD